MATRRPAGKPSNPSRPRKQGPRQHAVPPSQKNVRRKLAPEDFEEPPLLQNNMRHSIIAIALIVVAIAALLIILIPTDAVVASFLAVTLHRGLGIGAYLLPLLLAAIGIIIFLRFDDEPIPLRTIAGLLVLYLGLLFLIALFTPSPATASGVSTVIFDPRYVESYGGYLGAGPAYLSLMMLGLPVSVILALGVIAVGFAIIGFSLRRLWSIVEEKRYLASMREEVELGVVPADPYEPILGSDADVPKTGLMPKAGNGRPDDATVRGRKDRRKNGQPDLSQQDTEVTDDGQATRILSGNLTGQRRIDSASSGTTQMLTRRLGRTDEPQPEKKVKSGKAKSPKAKSSGSANSLKSPDDTFVLPDMSILKRGKGKQRSRAFDDELRDTAAHLQQTMEDFGIMATVVDWVAGPTVTLFEVDLPPGVRVSRLIALKDDIALALAAPGVRIFAPIPKTHYVGIEVPNATRENVLLGDILKDVKGGPLEVAIGKDVEGNPIIEDLAKMPHLLIGGTTGSGKSVGINAMIMSILMRATPKQVRFIMIDPKRVEFAPYDGIPHLYVPVVTEPKEAASALSWGVAEMELRLKTYQKAGVRNISSFNSLVLEGKIRQMIDDGTLKESDFPQAQYIDTPMPYIVIVIDELADLMMNVGKEVEFSISRIAQLARAAGIHLIVATQRPSANVVTGLIKANITTRIAYNVASGLDSRVILDTTGAESLIGLGDLLIDKPELGKPLRVQGCFTSDQEINDVVEFIKAQGQPEYHSEILKTNLITLGDSMPDGSGGSAGGDDPLIWEAAEIVVSSGMGSTSNIQRKLKVGYSRAGRIMDMLEEKGVVGPPNGSKPRDVLVDALELESLKAFEASDGQS